MSRPVSRTVITALGVALLGACQTTSMGAQPALSPSMTPGLGSAVKHNIAAMAVPATPEEKADTYIPVDRAHRARTLTNYREGTVPEPQPMTTRGDSGE